MSAEQIAATVASFLPMILLFVIMYVILILPQRRKEKKNKEMLNALKVGEEVVTIGGIMGKVINIKDDEVTIESGVMKTKILVKRWAVKEVKQLVEA
jgi:preprotein translocase subunit YajC